MNANNDLRIASMRRGELVEEVKRLERELVVTRAQVVMLQDELDERDSARPKLGPLAKRVVSKLVKFARKLR